MRVLIGMSGGVDSSVCAALINEQHTAAGVTLRLCDTANGDTESADAAKVCQRLNIPHRELLFYKEFEEYVIKDFVTQYELGNTPNPCIVCNNRIKFGLMLDNAKSEGFDKIATGHYARIEKSGDRYLLKKAIDTEKDQSYVLYGLTSETLSQILLPLGEYTKAQVRQIAEEVGFVNARKSDSQDICFVPNGDYADFITRFTQKSFQSGEYIDTLGNVLGKHKGIINYTIGQRKGLGIALGKPAFVIEKDAKTNRVILGDEEKLFYKRIEVCNVNLTACDRIDGVHAAAKLRYRHKEQPCTIYEIDKDRVILEFESPQRAPAPAQSAVFYDGDTVLGGGTIVRGIK